MLWVEEGGVGGNYRRSLGVTFYFSRCEGLKAGSFFQGRSASSTLAVRPVDFYLTAGLSTLGGSPGSVHRLEGPVIDVWTYAELLMVLSGDVEGGRCSLMTDREP